MIRGVPINQIYSHPVMDDICTTTKYTTLTSSVHSSFRSKDGIHHLSLWE